MNVRCIGCGAEIQTDNINKKGYIDKKVLENRKDSFYCKRCFDLKHYNKSNPVETSLDEYLKNIFQRSRKLSSCEFHDHNF